MKEQHIYADPEIAFHVWVRETSGGTARWVLRDASKATNQLSLSLRADASRLPGAGGGSSRSSSS